MAPATPLRAGGPSLRPAPRVSTPRRALSWERRTQTHVPVLPWQRLGAAGHLRAAPVQADLQTWSLRRRPGALGWRQCPPAWAPGPAPVELAAWRRLPRPALLPPAQAASG